MTTNKWSYPANVTTTTVNGITTETPVNPTDTFSFVVNNVNTAPAASSNANVTYNTNTASVATVVQNTLGYDAMLIGFFNVASASVASCQLGVGPVSPVPMTTVVSSFTDAGANTLTFPAYVPAGYYYSFQATQANGASVNGSFVAQWQPV